MNMVILVSNGQTIEDNKMRRSRNGAKVIVVAQRKYARWQKLDSIASEPVEANIIATDDYPYISQIMPDVVTRVCDGNRPDFDSFHDFFHYHVRLLVFFLT